MLFIPKFLMAGKFITLFVFIKDQMAGSGLKVRHLLVPKLQLFRCFHFLDLPNMGKVTVRFWCKEKPLGCKMLKMSFIHIFVCGNRGCFLTNV